ncbi:MAG TPA: four helix bundle protein [Terriglobales bacterium]|nr:four helix bundle protein [Terriglobales bacterium]
MKDFRQLTVWEKAHQTVLDRYRVSARFPADERFGLTSQIRRCSVSIAANIAEGCGRESDGDFQRFLQNAMGSARELDYELLLARDLEYLPRADHSRLHSATQEIQRMLGSLIRKVAADRAHGAASNR